MKQRDRALVAGLALGAGVAALARARRRARTIGFEGRTVLITGASRGLGLVLAREFGARGARLVLLARDYDELERARQELEGHGIDTLIVRCDVSNRLEVDAAVQHAVERLGRIDVLVNNAGVIQVGPFDHMTEEDYREAMGVHLWGALYTMLAVIPLMRRQGGGRIVNVSSIGGKIAPPHLAPYAASKFALVGLSDAIRAEVARDRIYVTTVAPGLMRTGSPLNAWFKGRHRSEFAWFALFDSLPLLSIDDRRAARQIVEACRRGEVDLTITPHARLAVWANAIMPSVVASAMVLFNRLLPMPAEKGGEERYSGWQSASRWAPSILTRLSNRAAARNNELPRPTYAEQVRPTA